MASDQLRWVPKSIVATWLGSAGPQALWDVRPPGETIFWCVLEVEPGTDDPLRVYSRFDWATRESAALANHFQADEIDQAWARLGEAHKAGGAVCLWRVADVVSTDIWWRV